MLASNASKGHLPNYLSFLEDSSQIIGKCFKATPWLLVSFLRPLINTYWSFDVYTSTIISFKTTLDHQLHNIMQHTTYW